MGTRATLPSLWTHRTRPQGLGNDKTVSTAPTVLILCSKKTSTQTEESRECQPCPGISHAEARAWHAFTQWVELDAGFSNDSALRYESEEDLRRALCDEPSLSRAHATFAAIYFMHGRKELMIAELSQALKANPEDADALHFLMLYHHYNGEYGKAQHVGQRVVEHLPLFFPTHMILADMLRQQGDLAGDVREQEKILEQDPQNVYAIRYLARAHMDASDLQRARQTLERARPHDRQSHWTRLMWAMLLALEGQAPKEVDDGVPRWGGRVAYMTYDIAALYAARGDVSGAFEWLDRAVRSGDERVEYFRRDPLLGPIRKEPRFEHILGSIEYRRKHRRRPVVLLFVRLGPCGRQTFGDDIRKRSTTDPARISSPLVSVTADDTRCPRRNVPFLLSRSSSVTRVAEIRMRACRRDTVGESRLMPLCTGVLSSSKTPTRCQRLLTEILKILLAETIRTPDPTRIACPRAPLHRSVNDPDTGCLPELTPDTGVTGLPPETQGPDIDFAKRQLTVARSEWKRSCGDAEGWLIAVRAADGPSGGGC